jgi:hypothetical protein
MDMDMDMDMDMEIAVSNFRGLRPLFLRGALVVQLCSRVILSPTPGGYPSR